jgi:hypothetical protein
MGGKIGQVEVSVDRFLSEPSDHAETSPALVVEVNLEWKVSCDSRRNVG